MGPTARIPLTFRTQITKHTAGSANWGASGQYSLPKTQWNRLENHAISGSVAGLQNLVSLPNADEQHDHPSRAHPAPLTSVHNCRNQSPMKSICTLLLAVSFSILVSVRSPADEVNSVESGSGLIWLAATVHLDGGTERIDLGDVHGVLEGDRLAVFRSTDGHHTPVGTIQVTESRATWSYINTTAAGTLREGDLVLGVRNVRQQGTGDHMQNGFLRRQLIRSGSRNGYSSTDRVQSALTLRSLVRRQNRWVKEKKEIAGSIRSPSITQEKYSDLQPLRNQILRMRDLQEIGIPLQSCMGDQWDSATAVLTPAPTTTESIIQLNRPSTSSALPADEQLLKRIQVIRDATDVVLFDRFQEEQRLAVLICTAIDKEAPSSEAIWIGLQLSRSQFPELADDKEMLEEIPEILRRVRATLDQ